MENIKSLLGNKDLRGKLLVLLLCLGIYKLGMHIYVPGIDRDLLNLMGEQGQGVMSLVNSFTGGALYTFSIFAVGIMPYITASIIIQMLAMGMVPKLTELKNQGEMGKREMKKITYIVTMILAAIQSLMMSFGFNSMYPGLVKNESISGYLLIALVLTLGTAVLVVLGEIIDRKGIGKGMSMIILAGILMSLPDALAMYFASTFTSVGDELFLNIIQTVLLVLFAYVLFFAVIVVNGGERRIPINTTKPSTSGRGNMTKQTSYLPIKINVAGVIPVIFASALFMIPMTITGLMEPNKITAFINTYFSYTSVTGIMMYALLILVFTYFYAFIQMDPKKVAENLKQSNSFIPSMRPGSDTEEYLKGVLKRLTFIGAIFLALVSILPMLLGNVVVLPQQFLFGGTSIIIIVSVIVDFKTQISSKLVSNNYSRYSKFIKNKYAKSVN